MPTTNFFSWATDVISRALLIALTKCSTPFPFNFWNFSMAAKLPHGRQVDKKIVVIDGISINKTNPNLKRKLVILSFPASHKQS